MNFSGIAPDVRAALHRRSGRAAGFLALVGIILWWACNFEASHVPLWAPWDFSLLWYGAYAFAGWSYVRGLKACPQPVWRMALFVLGMAAIWTVLQTHFEYAAEHMFFLNRIQHVVMHHLGPFLIALAWPWATLYRGMPAWGRRIFDHRWLARAMRWAQQPEIACVLFVGLIALWLYPPVHFVAMINPWLYQLMNWSMVVDGLLFWCVVLDPRPREQAHNSFAARAMMGIAVMFPQIAIGAIIAFADHDVYGFYAWCEIGRAHV